MRESLCRLLGSARHERQFGVDLCRDQELCPTFSLRLKDIKNCIGIAAEAVAIAFLCNELRHDIDTTLDQIACRMGVVGGNVSLLCTIDGEPTAGEKEELIDLDIVGHGAVAQRFGISEVGIAAE